jgi:adenylate cyclase
MAAPRLTATSKRARLLIGIGIGLAVGAVVALARRTNTVDGLEMRLIDSRTLAYLGKREADPGIVLAVVQSEDLSKMRDAGYTWPWPLDVSRYAFEWMAAAGVRGIVVDVYQFDKGLGPEELGLKDPGPLAPDASKDAVELHGKLTGEYQSAVRDFEEAKRLTAAYRMSGNVVLAFFLSNKPPESGPVAAAVRGPLALEVLGRMPWIGSSSIRPASTADFPVAALIPGVRGLGFANASPDRDGIQRRFFPVRSWNGRGVASLSLAAAMLIGGGGEVGPREVMAGDIVQPLSPDGSFLISLRGAEKSYAEVSPADMVIAGSNYEEAGRTGPLPSVGSAVPEAMRGKIVIWGVNAPGFQDVLSVPGSDRFPGPEYQATALDNFLHGDGRVEVSPGTNAAILLSICGVLGGICGLSRRRGVPFMSLFVSVVGFWLVAYRMFANGTSIDLFTPSIGLVLTFASVAGFKVLTEGRRNKWLEGTFGQYLSPAVIAALKRDPTLLALGGVKRTLTILFSDIKGFTTISEKLKEGDTVRLLNDYLTRQSACVLEQDGVIDKFIGDAVMAFFGDPVAHGDHAVRGCRAAVRSIAAVEETQPLAKELGVAPLTNRIGLAGGPAVVGNIGSERRFNYTCIGDVVNFASRLEGANKAFGSRILLADATRRAAGEAVVTKPLAKLVVVGKTEPVPVHELIAMTEDAAPDVVEHAREFGLAHAAVLADDLDAARRHLAASRGKRCEDGPCAWLEKLIEDLASGSRPRPWDGVWVLDSK